MNDGQQKPKTTRFTLPKTTVPVPARDPSTQYRAKAEAVWRRSNRRNVVHFAVGLITVLTILGIAFGIVVRNYRREQARAQRQREEALKARLAKVSLMSERVGMAVRRAGEVEREIRIMADKAAQAVAFVLAEEEPTPPKPVEPPRPETGEWSHPNPHDRPPGDLSYAELEALRRGRPITPDRPKPAPRTEREIEKIQRDLVADADAAAEEVKRAQKTEQAAVELANAARAAMDFDTMDEKLDTLQKRVSDATEIVQRADELLNKAQQKMARVQEIRAAVEKAREERKAEAERTRKERERLAKIQGEIEAARKAQREASELLKINAFSRALELLVEKRAACETEEGRAALELPVARYTRIAHLHEYILGQLKAEQFPWGWIQDGSSRDVLGADEKEVRVTGKSVPWSNVTPAQYFHFVRRFVSAGRLKGEVLGQQSLNAAVLAHELGVGKLAATFVEQALAASPGLRLERERILPEDLAATDTATSPTGPR